MLLRANLLTRLVGLGILLGLFYLFMKAGGGGYSMSCVNADCQVNASSGFAFLTISATLLGLVLVFKLPPAADLARLGKPAGYVRRFLAFFVDFFAMITIMGSLSALAMLLAEYGHTGSWSWSFERDYARWSDWFAVPISLGIFAVLYFYYSRAADAGRQTFGQFLFGFRAVVREKTWSGPIGGMFALFAFFGVMPLFMPRMVRSMNKAVGLGRSATGLQAFEEISFELVREAAAPHADAAE
jgi:hypothetical protein